MINIELINELRTDMEADTVLEKFLPDDDSINEMERRIKAKAADKATGFITYSQLVEGIGFINERIFGEGPHFINSMWEGWDGVERKMIGSALAVIALRNYDEVGAFITAIVILKNDFQPSPTFFEWLHDYEILESLDETSVSTFWVDQFRKTMTFYQTRR